MSGKQNAKITDVKTYLVKGYHERLRWATTATSYHALSRFVAIGSPMAPTPTKPTRLIMIISLYGSCLTDDNQGGNLPPS